MDPALVALCNQTITITPQSTVSLYNTPTFDSGDAESYQARVEVKSQMVMGPQGQVIATKGRVYLVPVAGRDLPKQSAQLTLPSNYPVRTPPIVSVSPEIDENGNVDHIVVYFA